MKSVITIIVPVYNAGKYLNRCITSLVNQTYSNLEILVIDDGSSDDSVKQCDVWATRDTRINVFHIANSGVSHARNVGLAHAHGDYIGFVDADDWVEPDMYQKLLKTLESTGTDVCAGGFICDGDIGATRIKVKKAQAQIVNRKYAIKEIFNTSNEKITTWALWDKLFKKNVLINVKFDEKIMMGEDMLFLWQAMKNINTFAYTPIRGYHYVIHAGSATQSNKISTKDISLLYALKKVHESSKDEIEEIRKCIKVLCYINGAQLARKMLIYDYKEYNVDIKAIQHYIRKNISYALTAGNTLRIKLGYLYLCLPYCFCVCFRHFIR